MEFYNIFNAESRYNHKIKKIENKIKKHTEFLEYLNELIDETNEFIRVCEEKYDLNKDEIIKKENTDKPVNEIEETENCNNDESIEEDESVTEETESDEEELSETVDDTESEEEDEEDFCIIACDGCGKEFDIYKAEEIEEDGVPKFICPFCEFHNEIEDDEDDIEDLECEDDDGDCKDDNCECESNDIAKLGKNLNHVNLADELLDHLKEISSDEEIEMLNKLFDKVDNMKNEITKTPENKKVSNAPVSKKVIKIPEEVVKNNKVVIKTNSNANKVKYIRDHKFTSALKILSKCADIEEAKKELSNIDISLINDNNVTLISKSGNVMIKSCDDNHDIPEFATLRTNLTVLPHGKPELFYNKILNDAGIKKYNPEWHSIDIPGIACIVSDNNNMLNALNFNIENKTLNVTIVYNID